MLTWAEIDGQQRALAVLERAITTDHVHHAYLFTGPPGVGKFQVAHAMAAVVNCLARAEGQFADLCGVCTSCRKIGNKQHPDILFIEPDGNIVKNIKIAQIREIQKSAVSAPYEARIRVVILNDAHQMTEEASNALLKTLEEPSMRMRLILVTDQPHRLLDTIISRCQAIRFGALDQAVVVSRLELLLAKDGEAVSKELVAVAAGYGEGSLGRSLAIVRSGMLEGRREFLGEVLGIGPGQPRALLALAESWSKAGEAMGERLDVLKLFLRDVMLFKTSGERRVVNHDLLELVERCAMPATIDDVLEMIAHVCRAQDLLTRNVNAQLILEELLREFARFNYSGNSGKTRVSA
ncbi:MAG: DNA polymerase III subunit delta' [Bradymonadaceae bacterium]|nr:DNA polymerase III subunit delta' [Lujinxingiaceae bacterium]